MAKEENPICERCGKQRPTQKYYPDPEGKPEKVLTLCDECIIKDKPQEKIVTPKDAPPPPKPPESIETKSITRQDIESKIREDDRAIEQLDTSIKKLTQQLSDARNALMIRQGSRARLTDLLK